MARKGINTLIRETQDELIQLINSKLQVGIPHSVIELMLENTLLKLSNETETIIQQEAKKQQEEEKLEEGVVTETCVVDRKE